MTTDKILDAAEREHGHMSEWDEDPMYDDEYDDIEYLYDYPDLDDDDDLDLDNRLADLDDDDYGDDHDYDDYEPEEGISMRKPTLHLPDGMVAWIDSNSPGSVYIGTRANFEWHNHNGYAPCEITGECALDTLAHEDEIEGRWNLYICDPVTDEMVAEIGEADVRHAREWFERIVSETLSEYPEHYRRTTKIEVDGAKVKIEFHKVGHNASHEFSIGILEDGRIVTQSVGEGEWDKNGDPTVETRVNVLKPGELPLYIGHW